MGDVFGGHVLAERLYDQVVAHYDVRRRTALINERLSYSLDYLHTLGEHVRHQYSVRIERMIILLIFLELCVGVVDRMPTHRGKRMADDVGAIGRTALSHPTTE